MNKQAIRVLLVDDHELVRGSWKILLEHHPGISVVAECATVDEALSKTMDLKPDIVLVDLNLRQMEGIELVKLINSSFLPCKIIGLSVDNTPRNVQRMLEAGAHGFLTKTSSLEEIHRGIIEVYRGNEYVSAEIRRNEF